MGKSSFPNLQCHVLFAQHMFSALNPGALDGLFAIWSMAPKK